MITQEIKRIKVLRPIRFRGRGGLPCGEYPVAKRLLMEKGMNFVHYFIQINGEFNGESLSAGLVDKFVQKGMIKVAWGL